MSLISSLIICLSFCMLASGQSLAKEASGQACIYGKIHNSEADTIYLSAILNLRDLVEHFNVVDTFVTDQNGNFEFCLEVKMNTPVYLKQDQSWLVYELIIQPNDSLFFEFTDSSMSFKGNDNKYNRFIQDFKLLFYRSPEAREEHRHSYTQDIDDFLVLMEKRKAQQIDFLEAYFDTIAAKESVKTYFLNEIKIDYARRYFEYPLWHASLSELEFGDVYRKLDDYFFDFLDEIDLNDSSLYHTPYFNRFIRQFMDVYVFGRNYYNDPADFNLKTQNIYRAVHALPYFEHQIPRQLIYVDLFKSQIRSAERNLNLKYLDSLMVRYEAEAHHPELTPYIYELTDEFYFRASDEFDPEFTHWTIDGERFTLSEQQGNPVLLNFWSTTCHPSSSQIPHFNQLIKDYKQEGLVVVHIELNPSLDYLKNFIESMDEEFIGIQLHAKHGVTSDIAKKFNVTSTPAYVLIDKGGKVNTFVAPRPSSKSLIERIEGLLD